MELQYLNKDEDYNYNLEFYKLHMEKSAQRSPMYTECQFQTDELIQLFWFIMCEQEINWYDN